MGLNLSNLTYLTISGTGSAQDDTPIPSTDVSGYVTAYVETSVPVVGLNTVTGVFESSLDNTTWHIVEPVAVTPPGYFVNELLNSLYMVNSGSAGPPTLFKVRLAGRYFRFRLDYASDATSTIAANAYILAEDSQDPEVLTRSIITDFTGAIITIGQTTMVNSLPVVIASDQTAIPVTISGTVPISGTVLVSNLPTTVDTNYGTVGANTLRGAAQIGNATGAADFNAGATGAQTLRVTANAGSGTFAISAASLPLPTGAATSALQTQPGVDIGDVTVNNAAGAAAVNIQDGGNSITVDNTTLSVVGGGTEATALRVTIANDSTGVLSVDDNGGSLTVDGTVALGAGSAVIGHVINDANSGVDIGDVTINNAAGAAAVNIQDGGNSITVDGTVTVSNFPTTLDTNYGTVGASTLRGAAQIGNATGAADFNAGATGAQTLRVTANAGTNLNTSLLATSALQTQPGVDIGDVTINNAAGASAVNIQDGGNSITIDGSVTGTKTNNNAAPGATNFGVLPGLANAAAPAWTEGNLVNLSVDLTGNQRVKDIADGPVAPGTVAANSTLIGGQFNTTLPTLTNTQQAAFQVDSRGRLLVATAPVDQGRNQTNFFMAIQIVTTATDALLSLTGYKSGAAVGATTTPAVVTAAKTYRITSITMSYTTIVTTPGSVRFTLRANTGGTVVIGSPAVCNWEVGEPTGIAPVAGKKNTVHLAFPDGLEFAAGTGIGISQVGLNTVGAAAAVGYGQITINGFEY